MMHQMVSEALKFEAWDGDWLELEEWLMNWQMYIEAGCPGIHDQARTSLVHEKLRKQQA